MTLGPPGQFPLHCLIKFLLEMVGKWLCGLLGSFLYISLLNPYQKAVQNGPGASKALSFTLPY